MRILLFQMDGNQSEPLRMVGLNLQKGANLNAFSGIFDGAGHTITVPEGGLPLFGYVRNTRILQPEHLWKKDCWLRTG